MPKKDECNEEELNHAFKLGVSNGWRIVGDWLFDEATKAFQMREDKTANMLRKYSDMAKERAEKEHPGVRK